MTKKLHHAIVAVLIGGCVLLISRSAQAQDTSVPTLVVALEKKVITQHEPAIMGFTIRNSSLQDIAFDLGDDFEKVDVKVTDTDGRVWRRPRLTAQEVRERVSQGLPVPASIVTFREVVYAAPGATGVSSIVLNDGVKFDKVGTYHINVALPSPSNSPSGNMRTTETSLILTVLSRDEASLASACAALVTRVVNSKSAADAITAADALSKVDDPAAVPFLAQAMERNWFTSMMIAALARLNTPDAVNALISASRSSDPEESALARAALVALGKPAPPRKPRNECELRLAARLRPRRVSAQLCAPQLTVTKVSG